MEENHSFEAFMEVRTLCLATDMELYKISDKYNIDKEKISELYLRLIKKYLVEWGDVEDISQ